MTTLQADLYGEACKALGEAIVENRVLRAELIRREAEAAEKAPVPPAPTDS